MKAYGHRGDHSGVTHYESGEDYIKILFNNGAIYLYTNAITGKKHIIQMKKLAEEGRGLSTYVSQHVKDKYATKLS